MERTLGPVRKVFQPWTEPAAIPFMTLDGVTKRFGQAHAASDQSLAVYEREFLAVLGPAGCGKTSLLRMLAGLEPLASGTLTVDGEDIGAFPARRRPVNMMFQPYALFPNMDVEKNIAFGLKQDGLPSAQIAERVGAMVSLLRLEDCARQKPHQLSDLQSYRTALARALAKHPKVLLLDEPLAALDPRHRGEAQFELSDLQEKLGINFVLATSDQELAMSVADRIAVMALGEIIQFATPAEIYEAPASRYVAGYIGAVNMFRAVVYDIAGSNLRLGIGADRFVETKSTVSLPPGAEVWFAIRPEKMTIAAAKETAPPQPNQITGKICDIAYLGNMTVYHVRLDDGTTVRASRLNSARTLHAPLGWDDPVRLTWPDDAGLLLEQ